MLVNEWTQYAGKFSNKHINQCTILKESVSCRLSPWFPISFNSTLLNPNLLRIKTQWSLTRWRNNQKLSECWTSCAITMTLLMRYRSISIQACFPSAYFRTKKGSNWRMKTVFGSPFPTPSSPSVFCGTVSKPWSQRRPISKVGGTGWNMQKES